MAEGPYTTKGLDRRGLNDPKVRHAMSRVPRHRFVPEEVRELAYEDRAVGIGQGQTISQPYIVALMTESANISQGSKVLEIGTGSGYQAAVLAELGAKVYSIEIVPELADQAARTLRELGYAESVEVRTGDGWKGWAENAPFDAILVTAAAPSLPERLITQLADHGRMVIPLEENGFGGERLLVIERDGADLITRDLGGVRFVPLTGEAREFEAELDKIQESATEEALGLGDSDEPLSPLRPEKSEEK